MLGLTVKKLQTTIVQIHFAGSHRAAPQKRRSKSSRKRLETECALQSRFERLKRAMMERNHARHPRQMRRGAGKRALNPSVNRKRSLSTPCDTQETARHAIGCLKRSSGRHSVQRIHKSCPLATRGFSGVCYRGMLQWILKAQRDMRKEQPHLEPSIM